ncbi:MAG: tRNA glutamyl-Q(34) synthetase GluQRS [Woeseiaceae bacterium]|nr:tRNA glutamyl-Q(34) synthetase GluQRS [Woeseiaceae bacterium]
MQDGGGNSYVGRFAPSPTGPLHFGSLLAACASYLEAKQRAGRWLLRIEDIDPPREQPGAADRIIRALESFGFEWDGPVHYQSESHEKHLEALAFLEASNLTYHCGCSRKDLAEAPVGPLGTIYPGTCRSGSDASEYAVRVRVDDTVVTFDDRLQGKQAQSMLTESGDFIVHRRDKLIAYHLAVVVDDNLHGVNDIVRGIDLMDSTPRQIWLQRLLGYAIPTYAHIPVAVHPDGDKLSKLTGARELDVEQAPAILINALDALSLDTPSELVDATLPEIWSWAAEAWDIGRLAGRQSIIVPNQQQ